MPSWINRQIHCCLEPRLTIPCPMIPSPFPGIVRLDHSEQPPHQESCTVLTSVKRFGQTDDFGSCFFQLMTPDRLPKGGRRLVNLPTKKPCLPALHLQNRNATIYSLNKSWLFVETSFSLACPNAASETTRNAYPPRELVSSTFLHHSVASKAIASSCFSRSVLVHFFG